MDNLTIISILSASFTFIILVLRICIKSKCNEINFCGIIIKRDIKSEIEETKYNIDHNIKDTDLEQFKQIIK